MMWICVSCIHSGDVSHRTGLPVGERLPGLPRPWTATRTLLTVGGADVTQTTTNPNGRILWLYSGGQHIMPHDRKGRQYGRALPGRAPRCERQGADQPGAVRDAQLGPEPGRRIRFGDTGWRRPTRAPGRATSVRSCRFAPLRNLARCGTEGSVLMLAFCYRGEMIGSEPTQVQAGGRCDMGQIARRRNRARSSGKRRITHDGGQVIRSSRKHHF